MAVLLGILAHHRQPTSALVTHTVLRLPVLHCLSATGRLVDQKMNGWKTEIILAHPHFLVPISPSPNPLPNPTSVHLPLGVTSIRLANRGVDVPFVPCTLRVFYSAHSHTPTVVPAAFFTKRTSFIFPFPCSLSF